MTTSTKATITLVGDGIENPNNARTMVRAADMFGAACAFHDRANLHQTWPDEFPNVTLPACVTCDDLASDFAPRILFDNPSGAADVYGFSLPKGPCPAVVVGNERRGISPAVRKLTHRAVQLPVASRKLNCLNVAAAAAVALYYLSRGGGGKMRTRSHPGKHRPELLLLGPTDHFELGSAIRSAGALGWGRLFVEDRAGVWFGCDRITRSEGRGAARRGRNPIRIVPGSADREYLFEEVCVFNTQGRGQPIHRCNLARGPKQLVVIPDETAVDLDAENWGRLGAQVSFVHLVLPHIPAEGYAYRLPTTIALAEVARQAGRPAARRVGRPKRHEPFFDHALELLSEQQGETVDLDELMEY